MFLAVTQMAIGILMALGGALVLIVNWFVSEDENHIAKNSGRLALIGVCLVLVGGVALVTLFIANLNAL
jgi:hypothetical protein